MMKLRGADSSEKTHAQFNIFSMITWNSRDEQQKLINNEAGCASTYLFCRSMQYDLHSLLMTTLSLIHLYEYLDNSTLRT